MENSTYWKIFEHAAIYKTKNTAMIVYEQDAKLCREITYGKLQEISDLLFNSLSGFICNGDNIGILMKHSIILPSIIATIHRFDSAFVFLDSDQEYSNKQLIEDLKLFTIFTTSDKIIYDDFKITNLSHITYEQTNTALYLWTSEKRRCSHESKRNLVNIAYYIKTSGSTSIAKNVAVPHPCINVNIKALNDVFNVNETDIIYFSTQLTFDPSIVELYLAALSGAALFICPRNINTTDILFPQEKSDGTGITIWQTTPSLFMRSGVGNIKNIVLNETSKLRILALGGEPMIEYEKLNNMKCRNNKTVIYNLYGITEISCWASVKRIGFPNLESSGDVSIGTPLAETFIKIINDDNETMDIGLGNIQIGSSTRKCLVGAEIQNLTPSLNINDILWRNTGDLGEIKSNGQIYFRGRSDRVIKRYGHKVNLLEIETVTSNFTEVDHCACVWLPKYNSLLLLFSSFNDVNEKLWWYLKTKLEHHSMPDHLHRIIEIPLSNHGKVSMSKAYDIYESLIKSNQLQLDTLFFKTLREMLPSANQDFIENIEDKSFLELGGNSIMSLQLINKLENITNINYTKMFSHLMRECSLKTVLQAIKTEFGNFENHKLRAIDFPESFEKREFDNELRSGNDRKRHPSPDDELSKRTCISMKNCNHLTEVKMLWKINLGKCIDANPVLFFNGIGPLVLVGSHSGKVVAVDVCSGELIHMLDVSSRVEAPILCFEDTSSHSLAVIGCYDGTLWCLSLDDFTVKWKSPLHSMIKSKPCYHQSIIYAATYESVIWSICEKTGSILSRLVVGAQGISADLAISVDNVFAATLNGIIICARVIKNELSIEWKKQLSSPVFAKPTFLQNDLRVLFSEVKGIVHCLEVTSGNTVWTFRETQGHVFSSCLVYTCFHEELIVFGCHDHHIYLLRCPDKQQYVLDTRIQHSSPIYATPAAGEDNIVCIATEGDLQIINSLTKQVVCTYKLPGQVFSSPIVFGDLIVVGCRDDHLYCLKASL